MSGGRSKEQFLLSKKELKDSSFKSLYSKLQPKSVDKCLYEWKVSAWLKLIKEFQEEYKKPFVKESELLEFFTWDNLFPTCLPEIIVCLNIEFFALTTKIMNDNLNK